MRKTRRGIVRLKLIGPSALLVLLLAGCAASQQFQAVPAALDRDMVPKESFNMTAEHFRFVPDHIRVKQGTLVTIKVHSIDGTHGFGMGDFGIDETIGENETKAIEFYAQKPGEYTFRCSHLCGLGHLGMTGKITVE